MSLYYLILPEGITVTANDNIKYLHGAEGAKVASTTYLFEIFINDRLQFLIQEF